MKINDFKKEFPIWDLPSPMSAILKKYIQYFDCCYHFQIVDIEL